jgi:hypothetical protein
MQTVGSGGPGYPGGGQGSPGVPGGPGGAGDGGVVGGLRRLGARAARRSEPRLWVVLAAVGCLLAVNGVLTISGDAQVEDSGEPGPTWPGILLCLLVVCAGYLLMHRFREAPAASAGVTAVVLALPPLMYFLTFDDDSLPGVPFSLDAVLALSALVWLVSYLVGPGRGRPLLLGAALLFAWLFVLQVVEDPFESDFDDPPIIGEEFGTDDPFADEGFGTDDPFADEGFGTDDPFADEGFGTQTSGSNEPDWTTLGIVSLLFGAGYLFVARRLDRRRFAGTATPFVSIGLVALPVGILFLGEDLEQAGTGIAFVIAGVVMAWLGAISGRRGTTVIGALEVLVGVGLVIGDAMEESSPTTIGITLLVVGAAIVAAAHLLHSATGEPGQTTPGPSVFGRRPGPGTGAFVAPPGSPGGFQPPGQQPVPAGPPPAGGAATVGGVPATPGGVPPEHAPFAPPPPPPPPPGEGRGSAF